MDKYYIVEEQKGEVKKYKEFNSEEEAVRIAENEWNNFTDQEKNIRDCYRVCRKTNDNDCIYCIIRDFKLV